MALPFAARQQFLEKGYAILPSIVQPDTLQKIRSGALSSTVSRSHAFHNLPTMDAVLKCKPKFSDPWYGKVKSQMEKRQYLLRYYKEAKRQRRALRRAAKQFLNGRDRSQLSGDELWQLSEILSQETRKFMGRGCTSTIENDPQMLMAINDYRVNAWMTNSALGDVLRNDASLKASLCTLAEVVGGVENPVVFSDAPILRPRYSNPVAYHATAPQIGTLTNHSRGGGSAAVTLVVFTYTPSKLLLPPCVLENSHRFVKEQYARRVPPKRLFTPFQPLEAHIPSQIKHFHFDASVVGRTLPLGDEEGEGTGITAGAVMVVDPHLMTGFGPNFSGSDEVIYRLNVVNKDAKPFLQTPSWIRGWRSLPREVNFDSPTVFPPLYC